MITNCFIVINLCITILFDIWVATKYGVQATISQTLYRWVDAYPGLAIAIGGLLGHLFFSQKGLK